MEYSACSFYGLLCKYEFFKLSLKYALRARNIEEAKRLETQLSDLSYIPRDTDGNAFDMRCKMILFTTKLKRRYDHLAEQSDVTGCCICMDALYEMTELLIDNQADDTKEFELCCNYPKLCKYEYINEGIKVALHTQQIEHAKYLKSQIMVLDYKPEEVGVTVVDMKKRLENMQVRLKERYTLSADRADVDDSIYCIDLLSKIEQIILLGENAILEEKDSMNGCTQKTLTHLDSSPSSSNQNNKVFALKDSIVIPNISSPFSKTSIGLKDKNVNNISKSSPSKSPSNPNPSPSQSYIAKYLAATSASLEKETSVLSGKWWLMDEDDEDDT